MTPSFELKEVKHGIRPHIPTEGFPVQFRARRLNPEKLAVAKEELGKLEKLGICYRGKSEWASPLMVAKKPCVLSGFFFFLLFDRVKKKPLHFSTY